MAHSCAMSTMRGQAFSGQGFPSECLFMMHPILSRQGHSIIAHRSNGGRVISASRQVPSGAVDSGDHQYNEVPRCEILSPLPGLWTGRESLDPPLKRWAIFGCPWRDKKCYCSRSSYLYNWNDSASGSDQSCSQPGPTLTVQPSFDKP